MTDWEKTKKFIDDMPQNAMETINSAMEKGPGSVKYIKDAGKSYWGMAFRKNGHECFLQYQRGSGEVYRILAFDNVNNVCYIREPLLEKDRVDIALGL